MRNKKNKINNYQKYKVLNLILIKKNIYFFNNLEQSIIFLTNSTLFIF